MSLPETRLLGLSVKIDPPSHYSLNSLHELVNLIHVGVQIRTLLCDVLELVTYFCTTLAFEKLHAHLRSHVKRTFILYNIFKALHFINATPSAWWVLIGNRPGSVSLLLIFLASLDSIECSEHPIFLLCVSFDRIVIIILLTLLWLCGFLQFILL